MCRVRAAVWGAEWSPRHQSRGAGGSARGSAGGSRTPRQELDAAFTGRALRPAPSRQHRAGPGPGHGRNHSSACCCRLGGKTGLGQHREPPRGLQPPPPKGNIAWAPCRGLPRTPFPSLAPTRCSPAASSPSRRRIGCPAQAVCQRRALDTPPYLSFTSNINTAGAWPKSAHGVGQLAGAMHWRPGRHHQQGEGCRGARLCRGTPAAGSGAGLGPPRLLGTAGCPGTGSNGRSWLFPRGAG